MQIARLMDQMQSSTDPAMRPKGQPGCDAFPPPAVPAGQPPWLTAQEDPLLSSSERLQKNVHGLAPTQAAGAPAKLTDPMQAMQPAGQTTCGGSPAPLASISRPRPTALHGTKPAIKPTRVSEDLSSKDMDHMTVCIPGPQSANNNTRSQSPTESSSSLSLQSPPSPQPYTIQPYPNFQPSSNAASGHSPKLSPTAHSQGVISPSKTTENLQESVETAEFRVYVVTWNVGSAVPPDDITALFGPNVSDGSVDMFIVGLQEVNSMINKRLKDALFTDQWSVLCMDTLSPFGYVLIASQRMQGVLLLVFSKFSHLPFLRGVQTVTTRTGLGGYWGNKGGVSARMTMFGHPVCFLNCHLPAHMRNLEQRMEDFESILQQQQFEGGTASGVLDHDVVFWFGDLNFRIEDYDIHVVKCAIDSNKLPLLWERDQLNMAKNTESILEGFMEGPLNFPPTYKFDVGTHTYDTSTKKRKPAWTDRILWRLRRTGSPVPNHNSALQRGLTSWMGGATKVTQHAYRSHMGYTISDHKPVSALFALHFPFKVDSPLVSLQVNKEWCKVSDATVRLTVASNYQRSSWDWVAIYKVGFKHHKDYVAYVWAKGDYLTQVTFTEEDLPRDDGEYILAYYSHNMNSIVGVTLPIKIQIPVHSPTVASRSDSSDISSEDDSTLVLLAPISHSPSPKTGKHHHHQHHNQHHRRSSHSPAVSNPLPSLQGLGLCPPRPEDGQACSRSPCSGGAKKERLVSLDSLTSPSSASPLSSHSPHSPRSPASPGNGVSAPEALIAAILGEHRPAHDNNNPTTTRGRQSGRAAGETSL